MASYDKANRLKAFQEGANYQKYAYDPPGSGWANRWVFEYSGLFPLSGNMPTTSSGYNAQNQIASAQYLDGRGNMTGLGAWSYSYDAENRLVSAQTGSSGATYVYDGSGQRVTKTWGSQTTTYVYDAMGNLAAEYGYSVPAPCTTCFVSVDQLGSTRVLTDAQGNVKERHDFMPFGDELISGVGGRTTAQGYLSNGGTPGVSVLFTGQYRDTELASSAMPSGLDYFGARHHAPAFGRFMQADQPFAGQDSADPQSWHLYGYALNNPLSYVDPTGRDVTCSGDGDDFRCVDNVPPPPPDPWAPGGALFDLWWDSVFNTVSTTMQVAQQIEQVGSKVIDWLGRPRDPLCMAGYTGVGATIDAWGGGGVGALGFAGGPVGLATTPTFSAGGAAAGGAIGGVGGLIMCAKGTGSGGGGGKGGGGSEGQPASEKTAQDMAKQVERDLGKEARRAFHNAKQGGAGDRTLAELKADAKAIYAEYKKTPPKWMQ